jgi:hypothetical protein
VVRTMNNDNLLQPGQLGYVCPDRQRHYQLDAQVGRGEKPQLQIQIGVGGVGDRDKHQYQILYQQHQRSPQTGGEPEPTLRFGEQDSDGDNRWTRGDDLPKTRYL